MTDINTEASIVTVIIDHAVADVADGLGTSSACLTMMRVPMRSRCCCLLSLLLILLLILLMLLMLQVPVLRARL